MRVLSISLVLALAAVPAAAQEPALVPHAYALAFRVSAPPDWEVRQDMGALRWMAVSPLSGDADTFRENLNVLSEVVTEPLSLSGYVDQQVDQLRQAYQDWELVERTEHSLAGHP
ncbi:hypothetical protein, partial [Longimicrobium sp.]|uniref:hypothetical protein n=1 Tax=Longimicrobium sp. TaxID=2029185 RepID=UPI002E3296A4